MIKLKISCIIFVVSSSAPLIPSALIPLLSANFPFFEAVDCNHHFFPGEFWDVSVLLIVFSIIVSIVTSVLRSCFAVLLVCSFIFLLKKYIFVEFRECVGNAFPRCFDVSRFASHFFIHALVSTIKNRVHRAAAGTDPVLTSLPPVGGRTERAIHEPLLCQLRTPGPTPSTKSPDLGSRVRGTTNVSPRT